jgi:hypothetical protein
MVAGKNHSRQNKLLAQPLKQNAPQMPYGIEEVEDELNVTEE